MMFDTVCDRHTSDTYNTGYRFSMEDPVLVVHSEFTNVFIALESFLYLPSLHLFL